MEVHHVRPVSRGGTDDLPNLRTLCRDCHFRTHAREIPPGVRRWRGLLRDMMNPDHNG